MTNDEYLDAKVTELSAENHELKARLSELKLLMEMDIELGNVVAGDTRKSILAEVGRLVPDQPLGGRTWG